MKLTKTDIRKAIIESFQAIREDDARFDRNGNLLKPGMQGYGKYDGFRNHQGYEKIGDNQYKAGAWFSRSCAVVTCVLLEENGRWFVLAGQRGSGTPDYQGYWNLPCGYLDYNENTQEAAVREVHEETGINISPNQLVLLGHSSEPTENRQNVCFFYAAMLHGSREQLGFSKDDMEENEVDGIQWLPIEKANTLKWAFDHDLVLQKALSKLGYRMKNGGNYSAYSCIEQAIDMLDNGSSPEEIKQVLQNALEQI